jgi:hypothetical protein
VPGAEPAFAALETDERRNFLLNCTRKKEAAQVPDRDVKSCKTYDAFFMCDQSPYADGLKTCKDDGDRILAMVNKIRADRTLLYDDKRDPGLGAPRYYHQFNHWKSYDCVKRTRAGGFKVWALEGITIPSIPWISSELRSWSPGAWIPWTSGAYSRGRSGLRCCLLAMR